MAMTDIKREIKVLLLNAIAKTLTDNDIKFLRSKTYVDVYHTYVSIPVQLASATDIKKALNPTTKLDEQMRFNICAALLMPPEADKIVILRARSSYLIVEVERDDPDLPTILDLEQDKKDVLTIGFAGDAHLQYRLFGNNEAGLACLGTTGSGKTNTVRLITALALVQGVEVHLIDYKNGDDFRDDIESLCATHAYSSDSASMAILMKLHQVAQNRQAGADKSQRILVVFDELHQASDDVQAQLALLISICRSANMRVLVGSQRFGKKIDADLRANITTRIVHRVGSKNESFNCCQVENARAEKLPGKGAAIVASVAGLVRVQIANAEPRFIAPILEKVSKLPEKVRPRANPQQSTQTQTKKTVHSTIKKLRETTKSRANFPPVWAFYFAHEYLKKHGVAPSYHYLNQERERVEIVLEETFKTITKPQVKLISEFCELWQEL